MNFSDRPKDADIWEPIPNITIKTGLTDEEREAAIKRVLEEMDKTAERVLANNANHKRL